MRPRGDRPSALDGEGLMALDWESLGREVRRQTLMCVALRFSELANRELQAAPSFGREPGLASVDRYPSKS